MANQTCRTPEKDEVFFAAMAKGLPVTKSAKAANYTRSMVYVWRHDDPDFAARWDDANAQAIEVMETEADRRAMKGTLKPVFHLGKRCGSIREFSDTLLIFRLKALAPEKYRERHEVKGGLNLSLSHEDALAELE